jgi:hypothetical protein
MKKPLYTTQTIGRGSVHAGEILTLREFGRRLGLANKALCDAQRAGLKTALVGRVKFVIGADALDWFGKMAEQQAAHWQEDHADE